MRILLTGATGKIGNAVARRLHERGEEVVCLVRDRSRAEDLLPSGVELAVGDVTDWESVRVAAENTDAAINAMGIFEQWTADPSVFNRVNAEGARNVVAAAREAGAGRVVHTSTFDVFDAGPGGTVSEDRVATHEKGTSYERSKQLAERLVLAEAERGIEVVIVNPAGIIGPGPWAAVGWDGTLSDAIRGRTPVVPPGGITLTWVEDAADAHVAALDRGRAGERYIVAGGYASVQDICAIAVEEAGAGRVPIVLPESAAGMLSRTTEAFAGITKKPPLMPRGQLDFLLWRARADSSKAREELGIDPLGWEESVRRTVRWIVAEGRGKKRR